MVGIEQDSTEEYTLERLIEEILSVRKKQRQIVDMMENQALDIAMIKTQLTQAITLLNGVMMTLQKSYAGKVSGEVRKNQTASFIKLEDFATMLEENPLLLQIIKSKNPKLVELIRDESNQIQSNSKQESQEQDKENKEESWY